MRRSVLAAVAVAIFVHSAPAVGDDADAAWTEMVEAEELIHRLKPALRGLALSVEHGGLPDQTTSMLFADVVEVRDLAGFAGKDAIGNRRLWRRRAQPESQDGKFRRDELRLWNRLFAETREVVEAEFKVVGGKFADPKRTTFACELSFHAEARTRDGSVASISSGADTLWRQFRTEGGADWRIVRWHSHRLEAVEAENELFVEALGLAVSDPASRARLRRSVHEEKALAKIRAPDSFESPHRYFFVGSQDRHPGLSVADVNRDGFDDIYVMSRWGANQLLVSSGDGKFVERASEMGLAFEDHSAAAIFADFDNDGDADLFLGRTMQPSLYLENRDGRFVERKELFSGKLPSLVSSVNAVDVDNDGLLDLYVSTYAAQTVVYDLKMFQAQNPGNVAPPKLLGDFLPPAQAAELSRLVRSKGAHMYLALPGPPNVLFLNRGDRFEVSADPLVAAYRNTYQATWADYDGDGDADVYFAHDFAPNQLLRNDGGRFVDVTEATGTADIGFGMGVTWGDYDGDGLQDLYVSNMYSKAGRRVTSYFDDLDARFAKMARGNSLFRNTGKGFQRVSGLEPPTLQVEKAGWSWGGHFADFDNDTNLDLYVASGYYTAPKDVEIAVDT